MANANASVAAVYDDVGNNLFNNPINLWQNLGTITLGTARVELWGCVTVNQVPTQVNVSLTNGQNVLVLHLLEYSGCASFGLSGTVSNTGYSSLFFQGTAQNNSDILVSFFAAPQNQDVASGSGTYNIPGHTNFVITPAIQRDLATGLWGAGTIVLEQSVINNPQLLISQVYLVNNEVATSGLMAAGVVLQGGFALATPPGFSDIDETTLVAGSGLHALRLNQLAQNASLGMVRPEFFYGTHLSGEDVPLPVSPVDQYQYSRDELIYIYVPYTTLNAQSGWTSADGILFYVLWDVDPVTGRVTITEYYHPDGNKPTNQTSDGQLVVLTVAQRGNSGQQTGLQMKQPPSLVNADLTGFAQDAPVTQTMMQTLARNSKFAAVKAEVFYMGEFVSGQQVPPPISYVDGYPYNYDECKFISSWKWTSNPNSFGPPPMANSNGSPSHGGWSQMHEMQAAVDAEGNVTCNVKFYNSGVVDPTLPANGSTAYGRLRVYCFTQRNQGPYFAIPPLTVNAGTSGAVTQSFVAKVVGVIGTVTGKLSVTLAASNQGPCPVTKVVVLKTAAGGNSVLSSTSLSGSITIPAGTQVITTPVAYTMDAAHDYYIIAVLTNGFECYGPQAGNVTSQSQTNWVKTGDVSGNSTISSMSLGTPDITNWYLYAAIHMGITGDTTANKFAELPLTDEVAVFIPGQPLPTGYMSQLAENVREGSRAVEFFGPTNHVNGDTIALPTSPVDGYPYSRNELLYIWQIKETGTPVIRLFAWCSSISAAGVVSIGVFHVQDGGPVTENHSGASIDVITIGCRSHLTAQANGALAVNNGNPPSDLADMGFGGAGGFDIGS